MTHRKLSDKFKIILAVAVVVAVAAAAITYVALSSSGSDALDTLSAGQTARSSDIGVEIISSADSIPWSTDPNQPASLGVYPADDIYVYSYVEYNGTDRIESVEVSGVSFSGEAIDDYYIDVYGTDSIYLSIAGIFTATVTLNTGATATFYAKIEAEQVPKTQLSAPYIDSGNRDVYTGSTLSAIMVKVDEVPAGSFGDVFTMNVSGVDFEGDQITISSSSVNTYYFDVLYAGTYTVTLTIKDTECYEWANADGDTKTVQFVVNRAIATVTSPSKDNVEFSDRTYSPDITVASLLNSVGTLWCRNETEDTVGHLTVELCSDFACAKPLTQSDIKVGATIYVKAGEMIAKAAGDTTYRNYRLPNNVAGSKVGSFKILGQTINAPASIKADNKGFVEYYDSHDQDKFPSADHKPTSSGTTVTAVYLNYGYKISHWFDQDVWNAGLENNGYAKGQYWKVTVNDSVVDSDKYEMKDIGTYTVKITPINDNYTFGSKNEYNFTLTIGKCRLLVTNFEWKDNKRPYTGNGIEFGAEDCVVVDLPSATDKVTVVLERVSGQTVINEQPVDVGTYTYRIKALEGEDKDKYTLPASAITGSFTIYRKELSDFSTTVGTVVTGTFNGQEQSISVMDKFVELGLVLPLGGGKYAYLLSAPEFAATISYPQNWGMGATTKNVNITLGQIDADDAKQYFVFTHAGNYSITLTADVNTTLGANYCWHGQSNEPSAQFGTYVWTNFAKIDRLEIDPSLPSTNISISDPYDDLAARFAAKFSGIGSEDKAAYTLLYGSGSTTSATPLDKDSDGKYVEGDYYVLVTLSDEFYPSVGFKAATDGEYELTDNGKKAKLTYSVSSSTVSIRCSVTNYTFGANFASGFGTDNVFTITKSNTANTTFEEPTYAFYTDKEHTQTATLQNDLPRNAGKYYVVVTVNYTFDGTPAVWTREYELNVDKRPANLAWTLDGTATNQTSASYTYSGSEHAVAVANTTAAGVPNVTVTLNAYSATNAGTHPFTATLSGDEADNYSLEGVTDTTFTITIAPAQITVTASDVSNLTFGDALTLPDPAYAITGIAAFTTVHGNALSVAVYNASGNLVNESNYGRLNRGTYRVVPVYGTAEATMPTLAGNQYVIDTIDNYVVTMVVDSFSVTSPSLEVTLHSGASSQYGDTVELYVSSVYSTNIEMTVEEFKQIVELSATMTKSSVVYQVTDDKAPIGTYTLKAVAKGDNGDYNITFKYVNETGGVAASATYKITERKITLQAKDVTDHPFGSTYYLKDENAKYKYHGYELTSGTILEGDEASLKIGYGVYQIFDKFGTKSEVTSDLQKNGFTIDKTYCHLIKINNAVPSGNLTPEDNGRYSYTKKQGNYEIKVVSGKFEMVAREIELTFSNNASVVYGTIIDFWQQQNGLSGEDLKSKYVYCSATNLRYYITGSGTANEETHADDLKDVIEIILVDSEGNAYNGNAGTYYFKATVKHSGYVIKGGQENGSYIKGGQFTVTQKDITVTVSSTVASIIYGNQLPENALDFTVSGLLDTDTKASLGMTVGIYSGDANVTNSISTQDVGTSYVVNVSDCTNGNYRVTSVTTASFAITPRPVTITADNVTGHVYGEAYTANLTFTAADKTATSGFVSDAHLTALGITASLSASANTLAVGDHVITLTKANDNANYNITLTSGTFNVVERRITITAQAVNEHGYGDALGANELNKTVTTTNGTGDAIVNGDDLAIVLKVYDGETDVTSNVAKLAAKTYTIKPEYTTNDNYIVTVENADFKVVKRIATITFKSGASSVYGEATDLSKAYEITGVFDADVDSVNVTATNADGVSASNTAPIGIYTVTVTVSSNYEVKYAGDVTTGSYEITKRSVKLAANNVTHTYGNTFSGSLSYALANDSAYTVLANDSDSLYITAKVLNGANEVTNFATLDVKSGGYVIELTKGANSNANYDVTLVNGTFTVEQREITLTFVAATTHTGSEGVYHTVYFADDQDSGIVDRALYSDAVVTVATGDLANGSTLRSVLSLTAVNGAHDATETHAPAGNYTITPAVIDGNYKLKNEGVTGVYVIGKAQLTMTSSYPIVVGTFGYNGEAQSVFSGPVSYSSVNGSEVTVLYKVTTEAYSGELNEAFFADGTTELPALTNVGKYHIYILAKADENHSTPTLSSSFEIVPVTLTVTAKPVELTYHDELASADWYEYEVTTEATVKPYSGLNADVLKAYLDKITRATDYTTSTSAGAQGIKITPVYDNGSNGDDNVTVVCVEGAVTVNKANITINSVTSGHASGVYTGEAFNLFGAMNATTVNSQAITWYYREVGQTDSDWKQYNNDTLTNVCSKQFEVRATAANHNDKIYGTNISFVITQNSITIKADDKSITYGAAIDDVISFSGQLSGSDNGLLPAILSNYINAVTYSASGYTVTTAAGSTIDITSTYAGDDNVAVTVSKGILTVNTRELTVAFDNSKTSVYGVQVTQAVVDSLCSVSGLVNNETVTVTAKKGETSLTSDKAPAGTYTVTVEASSNYTIHYTNGTSGAYEVTKRIITASLDNASVPYTEDGSNYHGGVYGAEHIAVVILGNLVSGDVLSVNNGYSLTYNTETIGDWQVAGNAPKKVGEYQVTVTLSNANYIFASDKTTAMLNFEVTKKAIDASQLAWNEHTIEYITNAKQDNYVDGYIAEIMELVSATKLTAQQMQAHEDPSNLVFGNSATGDCYYFDGNGVLHIVADGRAEYKVSFTLNSDAQVNYKFVNMQNGAENVELAFYVITEDVNLTINSAGWQYTDFVDESAMNVLVNGNTPRYGTSYTYAPVKVGADIENLLQLKQASDYGGFELEDVSDLFETLFTLDWPKANFDVGYYVICVIYDTFNSESEDVEDLFRATKYDIVLVSPKQLNLPTTLESKSFNGTMQGQDIIFVMSNDVNIQELVTAKFNGVEATAISGTNADTYTATITINDTTHYVWADDMNAVDGVVTVSWTITKDTKDNDGTYFTVGAIADSTYGDTITKTNPTAKTGYGSAFSWYFASKGALTSATEVTDWTIWNESSKPTNAGDYFVKVVLSDTSAGKVNFTDKVGYSALSINKATLHITLSGTLVYGNSFGKTYCEFAVVESDLIAADKGDANIVKSSGDGITYYLVDNSGSLINDVSQLEVDTYNLTALTENGFVTGLTADNYNIVLSEGYGEFTVTAKPITVTIGDASGQYGLAHDLTNVEVTYSGTDSAIVIAGVKAALDTDAKTTSVVRDENYEIFSTYTNKNFTIKWEKGTYTVTAREVTVTLDNSAAGGTYGSAIGKVTFTVNDDGNGLAALVAKEFTIKVVYSGTAYDGTDCGGETVPSHAGAFTANVIGDANNKNFALTIPASVNVIVEKQALDETKIKTNPSEKAYTGNAINPEPFLNDEYKGMYTVLAHDDFVEVRKYKLQIQLVDGNNYKWTVSATDIAEVDFEIVKAGIKVIPHATFTYGKTFANATFSYELIYEDGRRPVEEGVVAVDKSLIKYFVNDSEYDASKPVAGTYALEMERIAEGSDFVKGFTSGSYRIVLEVGELVVEKCAITLTVNNSSSIFSQSITLTNGYEVTGLVWGDQAEDVIKNYTITADPTDWRNADTYDITATATADNYDINYVYGTHTIKQIKVSVIVTADGGEYLGKAATVDVTLTADNLVGYKFPDGFETKLTRNITGSKGYDSSVIPTNAGSYVVTVTGITDSNYEFISSTSASFEISKKEVDQDAITIQSKVYNGEAQSHDIVGINGVYTVSDGVYKDAKPYDVVFELVDPDNYTWKGIADRAIVKQFEITKATLTLTPYGSTVYGNEFSQRACGYTLVGYKPGDDESVLSNVDVIYKLVNEPDRLTVKDGGYELTARADMTATNYDIVVVNGTFTVAQRSLNIKPISSTSVYSQQVVLSNDFEVEIGSSFVYDDDKSVISYGNVYTTATATSGIGPYPVMADASADNYDVRVINGTHTIEQIKVGVILRVTDSVYGEKASTVSYLSTVATNLVGEPKVDGLTFNLRFVGQTNGGDAYNSATMPKLAGLYRVSIISVNNPNYTIDNSYGIHETMFEIAQKAIDVNKITAQSAVYNGAAIRPVIIDELNDDDAYTVNYGAGHANGFVDVGVYELTLRLTDTDNYCWLNNLNPYTTIKFEITKANNAIVDNNGNVSAAAKIEIADWTIDGEVSKPQIKLLNGDERDVVFEYSANEQGGYSTVVPTVAGTYWVRAFVAESNNYNAYTSAPVSFVIHKRVVAMPTVVSNGASVYTGEMLSLDIANYDDKVMSLKCDLFTKNANGVLTLSALNAGTYTVRLTLRDSSSYDWEDSSKLVDGAVVLTWTIQRQVLSRLKDASDKIVVNGTDIAFTPEGFNSGIMTIEGNVHAHEGNYNAVVTLKDTVNYAWEGTESDSITVNFELTGTNTAFIAAICVVAGLCVGLGAMALILTLVNRNKKRKQAKAIDERSRADGWEGE